MKIPVWSFTLLSTYDRCPRQAEARYITKELPYVENPQAAHGNDVHDEYEGCIKRKGFPVKYPEGLKYFHDIYALPCTELMAEQQLGVTRDWKPTGFFGNDVWGRGKLDVTAILNSTTAILFDWKTGNSAYEDPFELEVQAVLLKAKYPDLQTIKGCYIYLKDDRYGKVYDLSSKIEKTKKTIEEIMNRVNQGLFYANKNALCGWCALTSCKHHKNK